MGSIGAVWAQSGLDQGSYTEMYSHIVRYFVELFALPRPGIEPGLEVPETSVMSFSLPGRRMRQKTELYEQQAADKASDR